MKLKIVKYEIKDVSPCAQFTIHSADIPKVLAFESDSDQDSVEIKTETLDVIKLYRKSEEFIIAVPKQIQDELDWCISTLEAERYTARCDADFWKREHTAALYSIDEFKQTISKFNNMRFKDKVKFLFGKVLK